MDSIRRFFVNFQKHGTISWSSDKTDKVGTDLENYMTKAKGLPINENAGKIQQNGENSKDFDNFEALPDPIKSMDADKNEPFDTKKNYTNTSECLEEFDEIMKEINMDMNTEAVSLDDVDDILTSITKEDETLNLETPRFDLQDLVHNFGLNFEDVDTEPTSKADFIEPVNLYEDIEIINLDESFEDESDEDAAKENKISREDCKENMNMSQDIFSLSSEDSQVYEPKNENKELQELKNVKLEKNINDSKESQPNSPDVLFLYAYDPESKKRDDSMSQTYEPKTITENDLDVKSQDIISINDSNDFEPNDIEWKNYETETISQANEYKTIAINDSYGKSKDIISINNSEPNDIEFKNGGELENVHDKNHENEIRESSIKSEYDSDDCGYLSSDFEFITEDEAKLDGLIINFNPKAPNTIRPKRVKTIEISIDKFSNECNSSESIRPKSSLVVDSVKNEFSSDLQSNNTDFDEHESNQPKNCVNIRNTHNNVRKNGLLRSFRRTPKNVNKQKSTSSCLNLKQEIYTDSHNDFDHKNLQALGSGFNFSPNTSQRQENFPGQSNLEVNSQGISDLAENRSEPNNSGGIYRTPRNLEDYLPGSSVLRENFPSDLGWNHPSNIGNRHGPTVMRCPRTSHDIQRWRAFQQRRKQFILDQTYRENHWVLTDEEYFQIFNPNHLPLPNRSMRTENKSTLSTNTMLVEYDGIGFDMQMVRGCNESEDEEVKEAAAACARRILEMYPEENRKRRRRF